MHKPPPVKVVCFGPGPVFKGGISNYNTSLAKALEKQGAEVHIVSWTQQYPSIIPREFKDNASKGNLLEGTKIKTTYVCNYNNPFSWRKTARFIADIDPDIVIFQWAIAIQGVPLGYLARRIKKLCRAEVVFDCHLVVQKEASSIDRIFTKYGLKIADTYITHAYKTVDELKAVYPDRMFDVNETGLRAEAQVSSVIKLYHPVYDLFRPDPDFSVEAAKSEMNLRQHVFLFFGFIRKYKGLHQAIEAFRILANQRDDVSLLIVGESFWNTLSENKWSTRVKKAVFSFAKSLLLKKADDERDYNPLSLVETYGLRDKVHIVNAFVPNEEVHRYFQVSDNIVLFYLTATPSGVESLSYNFHLPVLATRVGHFPETIEDGFNGYLANDRDIDDMAAVMGRAISHPIDRSNVKEAAKKLSWENYAQAILQPYLDR